VFSTGSLTKQFTATAILVLEVEGKLSTDDTIADFFDDVPADKRNITLHHLLTHTSGLPGSSGHDYEKSERDPTVNRILSMPLDLEPGTEMSYSNCGYTLLAAVIELVSGKSYERFLSERLFVPAGMLTTGYRIPDWSDHIVAHWYVGDTDNGRSIDKPFPYWNLVGNGGILSTTGDMYRWYRALRGTEILPAAAKKKLWTPFLNEYAYGWDVIETDDGDTLVRHDGGSMLGNSAVMSWFVGQDLLIVIFCNQSFGNNAMFELIDNAVQGIIAGESYDVPAAANGWTVAELRPLEGTYRLPEGSEIVAEVYNGALRITATGQAAIDALLFGDEPGGANHEELNDRARILIEAAIADDAEPFEREFGDPHRADRVKRLLQRDLKNVESMFGQSITGVSIIGTVPAMVGGAAATGVRIETNEGSHDFMSIIWREGRIVGVDQLTYSPSVPFVPAPGGSLTGYHLAWRRYFRAGVSRNGDVVTGLELGGRTAVRIH
jgi:CubicO group peptidase (beta-lactamase class C family)